LKPAGQSRRRREPNKIGLAEPDPFMSGNCETPQNGAFLMERGSKVYVAGGDTLIGAAILRQLERRGYTRLIGRAGEQPELADGAAVAEFFKQAQPEYVFMAGGKSGGIHANQKYPAELMLDNLLAQCHVIHQAFLVGVKKLVCLASSCSYPRDCAQPMQPQALLTGALEPTNEAYAVAKIAGIKLCEAYRRQYGVHFVNAIPANAFGPGDDFRPENSHVIAALLARMHEAKQSGQDSVVIWGTGEVRREFIYADDLAEACLFVMQQYDGSEPINLGAGADVSIRELALMIQAVVGYCGELRFDSTKPDGMPCKVLDSSNLLAMGWRPQTSFRAALRETYEWFLRQIEQEKPILLGRS
jgi:GDP-L-fucose synthase